MSPVDVTPALRIALEFEPWYLYKTGQSTFRQFADHVMSRLVLNTAPVEKLEVRLPDGSLVTTDDSADDFRWAFGRLLSGAAKARVNSWQVVRFSDNWVRIDNGGGDLRASHCIRRAAVWTDNRRKVRTLGWQQVTDELRALGPDAWYLPGRKLAFRGLECVDVWMLRGSLMQRHLTGVPDEQSSRCRPPGQPHS